MPQVLHANDQLRIQMCKGKVFQVSAWYEKSDASYLTYCANMVASSASALGLISVRPVSWFTEAHCAGHGELPHLLKQRHVYL